jgi:hypothetical protein
VIVALREIFAVDTGSDDVVTKDALGDIAVCAVCAIWKSNN